MVKTQNQAMISDFDIFSAIGTSVEEFERNLFSGRSGISNLSGKYGDGFPVKAAGLISCLEGKREPNTIAKNLLLKILKRHSEKPIDGVVFFVPGEDELANLKAPITSEQQAALFQKIILECTGREVPLDQFIAIHEACVSGLSGLSLAAQRIRSGNWTRALVLGVDLRCSPIDILRFHALSALSPREAPEASCPFSLERDGFVRSQGGAVFLLEGQNSNLRKQNFWGEIKGFCQTSDAWRLTEGRPDCAGMLRAIEGSVKMAGLRTQDIDCFSAHATSTPIGDALEARAIHLLWGQDASRLPVTALKSQIGHTGQASGLLQVAAALLMIKEQCLAPTINYRVPDPNCLLDCVPNRARPASIDHVLCNATAFGGQNASLVLAGPVSRKNPLP
jgi:3-oxoacyl-(acyl-carrier-protein) synthase